jgi:small subunit ribosomal protein S3
VGHKTHPIGFRIGTQFGWKSTWFSNKNYKDFLHEDLRIRKYIKEKIGNAGLDRVEIERSAKKLKTVIYVSKPGVVIGRSGAGIEELRKGLEKISGSKIQVSVMEVKNIDLSASLIAQNLINQIQRRIAPKRAMIQAAEKIMNAGAKGVKISVSGRIGGVEMARTEKVALGSVPLHTLDAEIDFSRDTALTKYGTIGVKVWVNRGHRSVNRKDTKVNKEKSHVDSQKNQIS